MKTLAGVPGVRVNSRETERVVAAVRDGVVALTARDEPEDELFAPPVIARSVIERAGYVRSFPQLLGTVATFTGDQRQWRGLLDAPDWHRENETSDVVLLPAACYHVYPLLENDSVPPVRTLLIHGQCYRHEASAEPGRMRSFRMTELVRIGEPADCDEWRLTWRDRVARWLTSLGLDVVAEPASDPFFGPADRLMRSSQLEQELKWELRVPVADGLRQAIASTNYHQDHFGTTFNLAAPNGPAHTACVAFGLDRIALALTHAHGPNLASWPQEVRQGLMPTDYHVGN